MRALLALALALGCPAPAQVAPRPELAGILRRHGESFGDVAAMRGADLYVWARATAGGQQYRLRILIRRRPFAYREVWLPLQGEGKVFVSDGRHAWTPTHRLGDPVTPGALLAGPGAVTVLEHALCEGLLYLDPAMLRGKANYDDTYRLKTPRDLPPDIERDVEVQQVHVTTPAGTLLLLQFDAADGRLLEIAQPEVEPAWFVRFGRWKQFGSLRLPSLRVAGRYDARAQPDLDVLELDDVRIVPAHPDALFAGAPAPALPPALDAGPLRLLPHTVPGMAHLAVTDMRVGAQPGVVMLVDTGADACAVVPRLADALRLLPLGRHRLRTATGVVETRRAWIDEVAFGAHRVWQLPASCLALPAIFALPPDQAPGFLLGGAELFEGSPVFDLAAGRFWLRGAPVTELARFAGSDAPAAEASARVVTLPFAAPRRGGDTFEVEVEIDGKRLPALFDTGHPAPESLSVEALAHFGLPVERTAWLARGAVPTTLVGAGGGVSDDLHAVLPSFRLGSVVYERPVAQISFAPSPAPPRAIVGCGALVPFRRVGLDDRRQRVELEFEAGVPRDADGTWRAPSPGVPLGLAVGSPATVGRGEHAFPQIAEVAPGSRAAAAGLVAGERLVAIAGRACAGAPAWSWNRALWLQAGESVELTVRGADGAERVIDLR